MRLSVVIPVWREDGGLRALLGQLVPLTGVEVILAAAADGEPPSGLDGIHVISCGPPCRGAQLDAGAQVASAPAILFLHADCIPPPDFVTAIETTLADPSVAVGAFSLALDAPGVWFRLLERLTRLRCRLTRTPYGDQGLFLRRRDYLRCGGFRPWPFLEDVDLVRRLRRTGRVRILPQCLTASARRYLERGRVRTTLRYRFIALLWALRVPPPVIWSLSTASRGAARSSHHPGA